MAKGHLRIATRGADGNCAATCKYATKGSYKVVDVDNYRSALSAHHSSCRKSESEASKKTKDRGRALSTIF